MLLSIQQKYILEVLRKLGCIRWRQLETLVQEKFRRPNLEISAAHLDAMLRQLRTGTNDVRIDGEFVWITGAQPDALRLEAVDVMLELSEGKPEDFISRVDRPGILRFSWGPDLRLFTVAELSTPIRPAVEALAHQKRVVWLAKSGTPPEGLNLPEPETAEEAHAFPEGLPEHIGEDSDFPPTGTEDTPPQEGTDGEENDLPPSEQPDIPPENKETGELPAETAEGETAPETPAEPVDIPEAPDGAEIPEPTVRTAYFFTFSTSEPGVYWK